MKGDKKTAISFCTFFLLLFPVSSAGAALSSWDGSPLVTTAYGQVQGFEDNSTTWVWKAIPYAAAPAGGLRWQAPADPAPWDDVRQSTKFCSQCPQVPYFTGSGAFTGSEDCLYLNIWRPRSEETGLAVYFWIHGGSNKEGSADPYRGAALAATANMVVVTINYRLGPLGWFTHPALREVQDSPGSSGNYATLDIIKALQWVHNNIAAFGGSPDCVTAAGQSAGGINVLSLMISPAASGLFHRAIAQSGGLDPKDPQQGDDWADSLIEALLVRDGTAADMAPGVRQSMSRADIRTYLYAKTAEEIFAAGAGLPGNPDVFADGTVLPAEGAAAFDDPQSYNQVPVIIGSTSEEGKLFMYFMGFAGRWSPVQYQVFGKRVSQLGRIRGLDALARKLSAHKSQPGVYCYLFQYGQYRFSGFNAWPTDMGPTDRMSWAVALGACHGIDIPFNFGTVEGFSLFQGLEQYIFRDDTLPGRQALSDAMIAYTAQFARTGKPDPAGLPAWIPWPRTRDARAEKFLIFDADAAQARIEMARDVQ